MSKQLKLTALLVTSQITQRSGLRKALTDIGFDNKNIDVASDYDQAKERLSRGPVNVLVSDEVLGKKSGMDLLDLHFTNNPVTKDRTFLIMAQEPSPFFMADFSCRGGDILLTKPFTNDTFQNVIEKMIAQKEKISSDEAICYAVQNAIRLGNVAKTNELLQKFTKPEGLHALYAKALVHEISGDAEAAYGSYQKVLKLKEDFKSLVSLIRIGVALQKHFEMLGFVEQWVKAFPLHHNSILDISRVIIANKKFELLDSIHNVFTKHKILDAEARMPLAAAFVMAASYHMELNDKVKGKDYIQKAIEFSNKKVTVLYKSLEVLMKAGEAEEAEKIYLRLGLPMISPEDKVIDIKLKYIIFPKPKIIVDCNKLLAQKVIDQDLFRITISCLKAIGKDPGDVLMQAKRAFPSVNFDNVE